MTTSSYVYFLAYAGPDADRAETLHAILAPRVRVFRDVSGLTPGTSWHAELPKFQAACRATVALLSEHAQAAPWLGDEIARAIELERANPTAHTLIPVFLDGRPSALGAIPSGVFARTFLDASKLGMHGVGAELEKLASVLLMGFATPAAIPTPSISEANPNRHNLYDAMCRLNGSQFEELLFRTGAPLAHIAPRTRAQAERALELLQWFETQADPTLLALARAIRGIAPGVLR